MVNNSLVLLDSVLAKRGITSGDDSEKFELEMISEILKNYAISQDEIKIGIVDGSDDGGIDALYTFVNGNLVTEVNQKLVKSSAKIDLHIFTVKYEDTYQLHPLESIDSSISELFNLALNKDELKSKFNERLLKQRDIFNYVYRELITDCSLDIKYHYISRGDKQKVSSLEHNIKMKADKIVAQTNDLLMCVKKSEFIFWGAEELLRICSVKLNEAAVLRVEHSFQDDTHFVATVKLKEFYKFISDENDNIKQYYFDSNVRNFLGDSTTNKDILDSLNDSDSSVDFWLLNNGITIIVKDATKITGNEIKLKDIQIVNGLQTSYNIHRYVTDSGGVRSLDSDNRNVLVKIIKTRSLDTKKRITKSTNNQTAISLYSLVHSNDQIQRDIELSLYEHGINYDRKSNQILDGTVANPLFLAKAYCALVMKLPYRAYEINEDFLAESGNYRKFYNDSINIQLWPKIVVIHSATYRYLKESDREFSDKQIDLLAPIFSVCVFALYHSKFGFGIGELISFNDENINQFNFEIVLELLEEFLDETKYSLRELDRSKVEKYLYFFANKQNISSVEAFIRKKDPFILNNIKPEIYRKIKQEYESLGEPFPGINMSIAKKLRINPYTVYKAIEIIRNDAKK